MRPALIMLLPWTLIACDDPKPRSDDTRPWEVRWKEWKEKTGNSIGMQSDRFVKEVMEVKPDWCGPVTYSREGRIENCRRGSGTGDGRKLVRRTGSQALTASGDLFLCPTLSHTEGEVRS